MKTSGLTAGRFFNLLGLFFNTCVFSTISLNYMLMRVAFSTAKKGFELAGEIDAA